MFFKSFWRPLLTLVRRDQHVLAARSIFSGGFSLARDHDRAESQPIANKYLADLFRPTSRGETSSTNTTEYCAIPETDFHSPFADYLADDAKIWTLYLDLTKSKGEELMRIWNSDLDTILIFAGLFSAILTAFLIETRKSLQPDSQDLTNLFLSAIIVQLQDPTSKSVNASLIKSHFDLYTPSRPFLWINGLWFVALTFSLAGAFGSILAKGWVAQFIPISAGLPIIDACNRHRRFFGDDQRHLRAVIAALPVTLHIGFYLFFGGLVVLLFQDDHRIGNVVTSLLALTMILYLGCSLRPILNPHSPFRTPLSGMLPVLPLILLPLIILCDSLGHIWFNSRQRRYKEKHIAQVGPYTASEGFCCALSATRKLWVAHIMQTGCALYRLMLVTNPPSDELRIDVLVGLFALARPNRSLDDLVCALAALPRTPRLQDSLYNTDSLPALMRNIIDIFSDPKKMETPSLPQAYLSVLLSLVQTTYSSLNWSPSVMMPLLEPGGILALFDTYEGEILELIICIQIHIRVRSGFLLPPHFADKLPEIVMKCTNPHHQRLLVEACLTLSVIDGGAIIKQLVLDDMTRQVLLDLDLGHTLSNMVKHPQKRVQKSALTAISALCVHKSSRLLLIEGNIVKLLLEHIPGSDSQSQCEALGILPAFIKKHAISPSSDEDQDIIYELPLIQPWIEDIFGLFLAAMLKSQQLNVQEAAVSALSSYLRFDYTRAEFLRLDHTNTLLNMLEVHNDSSLQLASLEVLKVLLSHEDTHENLDHKQFSRQVASILKKCVHPIKKDILEFVLFCLSFSNNQLKEKLTQELEDPLIQLFSVEHTVSEITDKISMILHVFSSNESTCKILVSSKFVFPLVNIARGPGLNTQLSVDLAQKTLKNILKNETKSPTFAGRILNDSEKQTLCHGILHTIEELLDVNNSMLQKFAMDLLFNCLNYYDLRQFIYNSRIIHILGCKLKLGQIPVKKASLNILLQVVGYVDLQSAVIKPSIVESLLDIAWKDWSQLSDPSLKLLTICMRKSRHPVVLLPYHTEDTLGDLLDSNHSHSVLAAMAILTECTRPLPFKNDDAVIDLISPQMVERVSEIFCSTTQLDIQDAAGKTLHNFAAHDYFRSILATEKFYSIILQTSVGADASFQSSALEVILNLSQFDDLNILLLKKEHTVPFMSLLQHSDTNVQGLILKIILNVTHSVDLQDILITYQIFEKLFNLGKCPDMELANLVLKLLVKFFKHDKMRPLINAARFTQLLVHLICSRNLELQQMAYQTFLSFMMYNDMHHKITSSQVTTLLYKVLYEGPGPCKPNQNLTDNERDYLAKLLYHIQERSSSSIQESADDSIPPHSATDPHIISGHATLDFRQSQNLDFLGHHALEDSDSSIFHMDDFDIKP